MGKAIELHGLDFRKCMKMPDPHCHLTHLTHLTPGVPSKHRDFPVCAMTRCAVRSPQPTTARSLLGIEVERLQFSTVVLRCRGKNGKTTRDTMMFSLNM